MRRRIMIVDPYASSSEYVDYMTDHLGIDFELLICSNGEECYRRLFDFDPDFIYINMTIRDVAPMTLLQDLRFISAPKVIIIGTDSDDTYYTYQLRSLNVQRVLISPYSMEEVGRQLYEIATFSYAVNGGYSSEALDYILLRLGIKCSGVKYECIRYAVELKCQNAKISIMKELYPALAKRVNGTINSVEKGLRDAIRYTTANTNQQRKNEIWAAFFPYAENKDTLSNDEFISRLALAVKHNERPRISMEDFLSKYSRTI